MNLKQKYGMLKLKIANYLKAKPKSSKILFASIGLAISIASATYIPFMFWGQRGSTSAGDITITTNTTITDANYSTYENKNVTINTGITVTVQATVPLTWYGLTMVGTASITPAACTTTVCYPLRLTISTDATIPASASITADGKGYLGGDLSTYYGRTYGNTQSGASYYYTGGSHGGYGGNHPSYAPNEPYGSVSQPVDMGSGGGSYSSSYPGSNGGGAIKLIVNGTLSLAGSITANGTTPATNNGGCGAGGSLWVAASAISGSGSIKANGGSHGSYCYSGGGGGRVAVYYGSLTTFNVASTTYVQAFGGTGSYSGGPGTVFSKGMSQTNGNLLISGSTIAPWGYTRIGAFGLVSSVSGSTLNMNTSTDPRSMKLGLSLPGATLRPDVSQSAVISLTSTTASSLVASGSVAAMTAAGKAYCVTDYETTFDNVTIEGAQRLRAGCMTVTGTLSIPGTGGLDAYLLDVGSASLASATLNVLEKTTATIPGTFTLGASSTFTTKSFTGDALSATSATLTIANSITSGTTTFASSTINTLTVGVTGDLSLSGTSLLRFQDATVSGSVNLTNTARINAITPTATNVYPLRITAANISVASGTSIDADGKGYIGGDVSTYYGRTLGNTQTGGAYFYSGGTYGGYGGYAGNTMNEPYGSITQPADFGSGGGSYSSSYGGTNGGGAIKLTVSGTLTVNGTITANGEVPGYTVGGCGSGGSVWVDTNSLTGSGIIRTNGGGSASYCYSGGGGGRIAIYYASITTFNPNSSTYVQANGGAATSYMAGSGTIYSKATSQTNGDLFITGTTVSSYGSTRLGVFGPVNSVSTSTVNMLTSADPRSVRPGLNLAGKTLRPDVSQTTTVSIASNTTTSITAVSSVAALTAASKYFCVSDYETAFDNVRIEGNQAVRAGCLSVTGTLAMPNTASFIAYVLDANTLNVSGAGTLTVLDKTTNPTLTIGNGATYTTKYFSGTDFTVGTSVVNVQGTLDATNLNLTGTTLTTASNITAINAVVIGTSTVSVTGNFSAASATITASTITTTGAMTVSGNLTISAASNLNIATTLTAGTTSIANSNVSALTYAITGDMTLSGTTVVKLQDATVTGALGLLNTAKITTFDSTASNVYPIRITANSMSIPSGTMIDADGKGYLGGNLSTYYGRTYGNTQSGASYYYTGGSHGGYGGNHPSYAPNEQYGSVLEPVDFGSGGGSYSSSYPGSNGGGAIKLIVTNTLTLGGTVTANGVTPTTNNGGCGAGGSVWISAGTISGAGTMKANGGSHASYCYGGGGGGRVAVYYGTLTTFNPGSTTYVQAFGGTGSYSAGSGTIFSKATSQTNGDLLISGTIIASYGSTRFGAFGLVGSVSGSTLNTSVSADPRGMKLGLNIPGLTLRPDVSQAATVALTASTATSFTTASSVAAMTSNGKAYCVTNYETTFDNVKIEGNQTVRTGCLTVTGTLSIPGTAKLDTYLLDVKTGTLSGAITLNVLEKTTTPTPGSLTIGSGSTFVSKAFVGDELSLTGSQVTLTNEITSGNLTLAGSTVTSMTINVTGDANLSGATLFKFQDATISGSLNLTNTSKIQAHTPTVSNVYPIRITAANISLASGTSIDVDGKGYLGGDVSTYYGRTLGNTQTGGAYFYSGGTHGGYGGYAGNTMNEQYGSVTQPADFGSGGGSYSSTYGGTNGGGAIKLTVSGTLAVNGTITANGEVPGYTVGGCGSGGSIWISANSVTGSGIVRTNGGGSASYCYSGGGGGRIAIYYTALTTFNPNSSTYVQSYGGAATSYMAGSGTIYSKAASQTNGDLFIAGTTVSAYGSTRWGAFGVVSSVSTNTLTMTTAADPRSLKLSIPLSGKTLLPDVAQSTTATLSSSTNTTLTAGSSLSGLTSASKNFCVTDYEAVFDNLRIEGNQTTRVGCLTITGTLTIPTTGRLDSYILDINTSNISGAGIITSTEKISNPVVNLGTGANYTAKNFIGTDFTASGATVNISNSLSTNNLTLTSTNMTVTNNVSVLNDFILTSSTLTVNGNINAGTATITSSTLTNAGSMTVSGALNISASSNVTIAATLTAGSTTIANSNVTALTYAITGNMTVSGTSVVKMQDATVTNTLSLLNTSKITTFDSTASNVYPIHITADSISIPSGTMIDADGKGYLGGNLSTYYGRTYGNTQSGASYYYTGGSHGGYGGNHPSYAPNEQYGSVLEPLDFGSGGGSYSTSYPGSNGGGVIKLVVTNTLTLGGTLTANGVTPTTNNGGCGAGGSVWVSAGTISGAGTMKANGGSHASYCYGGGGGGRIAVYYGSLSTFNPGSTTYVQTFGGTGSYPAGSGTIFSKATSQTNGDLLISGTTIASYGSTRLGAFGLVGSVSGSTLNSSVSLDPRGMKLGLNIPGLTLRPDVSQAATVALTASTSSSLTAASSVAAMTSNGKAYCVTNYETTFDNLKIEGNQTVRVGCLNVTGLLSMPGTGKLDSYLLDVTSTATLSGAITLNVLEKMTMPTSGSLTFGAGSIFNTKYFVGDTFSMTSTTTNIGSDFTSGNLTVSSSTFNVTNTVTAKATAFASSTVSALTYSVTGDMAISGTSVVKMQDTTVTGDLNLTNTAKILAHTPTVSVVYPVRITAANISLASGTTIDADGKGYLGGDVTTYYGRTLGNTQTGGAYFYSGGTHGGYGGYAGNTMNEQYGSVTQPIDVGSGGGSYSSSYGGTNGGGAVKLTVAGTLTLNGGISANGETPTYTVGGCGSGGSVWITANTVSGAGTVKTNGGSSASYCYSGGGGGRIAIYYTTLATFNPNSSTYVQSVGGSATSYMAGSGTIYSKAVSQTNGDLFIAGTTVSAYGSTRWGAFGSVASVSTNTLTMSTAADPRSQKLGISLVGKTLRPDVSQAATATMASSTNTTLTAASSLSGLTAASKNFCVTDYEAVFDNLRIEGNQTTRVGCLTITGTLTIPGTARLDSYILDINTSNLAGAGIINSTEKISNPVVNLGTGASYTTKNFIGTDFTATGATVNISDSLSTNNFNIATTTMNITNNLTVLNNFVMGTGTMTIGGNISAGTATFTGSTLNSSGTLTVSGALTISGGANITIPTTLTAGTTSIASSNVSALTYNITGNMTLSGTSVVKLQDATVSMALALQNTSKITAFDPTATNVYPIRITADSVSIPSGTMIDADAKGYLGGNLSTYYGRTYGNTQTGASYYYTGGSHGGYGGNHPSYAPNEQYGSVTQPTDMGSGGGSYSTSYPGSNGGGAIKLTIATSLTLGGALNASGQTPTTNNGGCGAGGSIWVSAGSVTGTGTMKANGGSHASYCYGGGGGGRVAVYYGSVTTFNPNSTTYVQAFGGSGSYSAGPGTIFSKSTSQTNGDLLISGSTLASWGSTRIGAFGLVGSVSGSTLTMSSSADPRGMKLGLNIPGTMLRPDVSQSSVVSLSSSTATTLTASASVAALTSAGKAYCVTDYESTFDNMKIEGVQNVRVGCLTITGTLSIPNNSRLDAYILDVGVGSLAGAVTLNVLEKMSTPVAGSLTLASGSTFTTKLYSGDALSATSSTLTIPTITSGNLTLASSNVDTMTVTVTGDMALSGTTAMKFQDATVSGAVNLTNTAKITALTSTATNVYPLRITAGSMSLAAGTSLDADGKGYLGGDVSTYYGRTIGNTQTGGAYFYSGGTHGGYGGYAGNTMNEMYGSILQPVDMGSGGGSYSGSYPGTNGGGAVKLTIAGALTLGGAISANGATPVSTVGGCGAGGSIWIAADSISGAGTLKTNGGSSASYCYSGGGGGRIAVYYTTLTTFNPMSTTYVQSYGGAGTSYQAGSGTIFSKATSQANGSLYISGTTVSTYGSTRWGAFGVVGSVSGSNLTMSTGADPRSQKMGLSLTGYTLRPDTTQSNVVALTSSTPTVLTAASSLAGLTSATKNFCVTDYESTFDNVKIEGNQNVRVGCMTVLTSYSNTSSGTMNSYLLTPP